jgi:hypothetical protein
MLFVGKLFILLSCMIGILTGAGNAGQMQCVVTRATGSLILQKGQSPVWEKCSAGKLLVEKDAIRTAAKSQADILLPDSSLVRLDEYTVFSLVTMRSFGSNTHTIQMKIDNGAAVFMGKKQPKAMSKIEITARYAKVQMTGASVGFNVAKDKIVIKVYNGEAIVYPVNSDAGVSLKANQTTTVFPGQQIITAANASSNGEEKETAAHENVQENAGQSHNSDIQLTINVPQDGQKFSIPAIPVSGRTTPGAIVSVSGIKCPIDASGTINARIPIPDEENQLDFEIAATLNGMTSKIVRKILYQPEIRILVLQPKNGQTIIGPSMEVSGQVLPISAALQVQGKEMILDTAGFFNGTVNLPDNDTSMQLVFKATSMGMDRSIYRTIQHKKFTDENKPEISPLQLPAISKTAMLPFTVLDKTENDEITFVSIADGDKETEQGVPSSSFNLKLLEGVHDYTVYATDKAGNASQQVRGKVAYLSRNFAIQMRKPAGAEVVRANADDEGSQEYTVQFSIINLPDNDTRLIKQLTVTNMTTGKSVSPKDLLDLDVECDIEIKSGKNKITVDVKDVNDRITSVKDLVVELK